MCLRKKFNVIVWVSVLSALKTRAVPNIYLLLAVTSPVTLYVYVYAEDKPQLVAFSSPYAADSHVNQKLC